jgi:hypothetical protein
MPSETPDLNRGYFMSEIQAPPLRCFFIAVLSKHQPKSHLTKRKFDGD